MFFNREDAKSQRVDLKDSQFFASSASLRLIFIFVLIPVITYSRTISDSTSTIVAGNARFEFLTASLVRMEYSVSMHFVDAPSAVIQKRQWPSVNVKSDTAGGWLTAQTKDIILRYRVDSGPFDSNDLTVTWHDSTGSHAWHPGEVDSLNLGGLTYSLDNLSESTIPKIRQRLASPIHDTIPGINVILPQAQPGLLSLSGYAFINDSRTPVYRNDAHRRAGTAAWNSQMEWIEPRKDTTGQDWYLFVYGRDYKKVLNEYAELCGHIPMIPRYALGPWITDFNFEYFPNSFESQQPIFKKYNEQHVKNEVLKFRDNNISLDVFVLDFGWHNYGWEGGFDWSPLIPKPKQFLKWLHDHGIKVSLNDHPGYANTKMSILSYEDSHATKVLKDLGMPVPARPTFRMDISQGWKFSTDPNDVGIPEKWFAGDHDESGWKSIRVGMPWQAQGFGSYHGTAWYRESINLPAKLPDSLYLYLGEVSSSYQLFVNGKEVSHSMVQWPRRLTFANIAPYVYGGQQNEIAIRVVGNQDEGGITARPVTIENVKPPERIYFDLSNRKQAEVFMNDLHKPLMQEGVNFWWVDGGSGAVYMPGLNEQLWTNRVYYDYTQKETNERGFIFSRYGGWGSERYPSFFTGDTYSEWPVLAYEIPFTAAGGNVLVPYITHDIGGFHGAKIPFDLYARWVEFGTFGPILRLHSAHENPYEGDVRMPWTYGKEGMSLAKKYFSLRTELIPYIYTYTWVAHKQSLPLVRPLYLEYPDSKEAYEHPHEYFFGKEMLVAPVIDSIGNRTIYLPPGKWIEFFTGKEYDGDTTFTAHYAVDETPAFVRDGSIIPEQPDMAYSNAKPLTTLIINIYGSGSGSLDLYEDDGVSLRYKAGRYALTPMTYSTKADGSHEMAIGPTKGSFSGQVLKRAYELVVHSVGRPHSVKVDGRVFDKWVFDAKRSTLIMKLPEQSVHDEITLNLE